MLNFELLIQIRFNCLHIQQLNFFKNKSLILITMRIQMKDRLILEIYLVMKKTIGFWKKILKRNRIQY